VAGGAANNILNKIICLETHSKPLILFMASPTGFEPVLPT
jgi:hypothetical protein